MIQDARGWYTGVTQRHEIGREMGGGFRMRKLWYIYTMEYYSAVKNNTFESVLMRWIKLEPIIQSEISQKKPTNTAH